jgi:hypothetical protein
LSELFHNFFNGRIFLFVAIFYFLHKKIWGSYLHFFLRIQFCIHGRLALLNFLQIQTVSNMNKCRKKVIANLFNLLT